MFFRRLLISVLFVVGVGFQPAARAVVALVDTGTNAALNIVFGFDFFANVPNAFDATDTQHGTTSSLIINEVAPGIGIGNYKVTDADFNTSQGATDAAVLSAAANPQVVAIALSQGFDGVSNTIDDASRAGKLVAIASGNSGLNVPNIVSTTSYLFPGVVIVGGTDGAGGILALSNRAGITANRYVATLGVTRFSAVQGTSFAAARLAGIAAEVNRQFPFLTGEELAEVILATAIDFGAAGTDAVYGRGVVFDAAQVINSPVGPPRIPTDDDAGGGGSSTTTAALVIGSAAAAGLLLNNQKKLKKTLILDAFGRPYAVDLNKLVKIDDHRPSVSSILDRIDERFSAHRFSPWRDVDADVYYTTMDSGSLELARYFALSGDSAWAADELDWSFSLRGGGATGYHYRVESNTDPRFNFGAVRSLADADGVSPPAYLSGQTFSTPYLGFADKSDSVKFGYRGAGGFGLSFGMVSTEEASSYGEDSSAAVLEGTFTDDRGAISVQVGALEESGSLFGGSAGGAFGVSQTDTYSLSMSGSVRLSDDVSVIGNFGLGYSEIEDARFGLLKDFSGVRTKWYGIGMVADNVFRNRDQFGIAFSQPLRVTGGTVSMEVPYARDVDGAIYKSNDRIGLAPDGREHTLETYYRFPLNKHTLVGAYLMMRDQPNHWQGAARELTFLSTLKLRF